MSVERRTALNCVICAGVFAIALSISVRMPWIVTGFEVNGSKKVYLGSITQLWLTALVLVAGVAAPVAFVKASPGARYVAVLSLTIVAGFSALSLIAVELFSNLAAEIRLLGSITKVASGARAAGGPWWTFVLSSFALIVVVPSGYDRLISVVNEFRRSVAIAAWLGIAALAGVAYVNLRMSSWVAGSTGTDHFFLPGASLPFLGSMSFISTMILFASAIAILFRFRVVGSLGIVFAGWVLSLTSAVVICLGPLFKALSDAGAPIEGLPEKAARFAESVLPEKASEWLTARIDGKDLYITITPSVWLAFGIGLLICAAGLMLLRFASIRSPA